MPRQKLLKKCLFLFIAPFDLWPLPWHECANLGYDHDNWSKIAWIAPKFACRLSFTQGSDKFENQFGRPSTYKMAADLKKWRVPFFSKCHNYMSELHHIWCTGGPWAPPSTFLVLTLVWRHVSFLWPYPFLKKNWRKWPLPGISTETVGAKWCNLGEIVNKGLHSGFLLFLTLHDLWPWHSANLRKPFRIFLAYDRIVPKSTILLPFDEGYLKFNNQFSLNGTFKMADNCWKKLSHSCLP